MRFITTLLLFSLFIIPFHVALAVDIAPRISDREIVERLTRLEEGQKAIIQVMNERFKSMDGRFKSMDERFNSLEKSIDKRFKSLDRRFSFLENLMMFLIAGVFGLIGFIVWDRKTALRPLERKLDKLEQDLHHDLELQSPEGSRLTRLIHALREQAKHDSKLAATLKTFSLL